MKDPLNIIYFMRNRLGMTQQELANKVNLTANDVCRLERGNIGAGIEKPAALAEYFQTSLDALVCNDLEDVLTTLAVKPAINHKLLGRISELQKQRDEIGREGENWVYEQEVKKLQGTVYANAVTPFWNDEDAHFDILSFGFDGKPIIIEVKSTNGKASKKFYLSADELEKAKECVANGVRYEIHRVHHLNNPNKRGRIIIRGEELLANYRFEVESYIVERKAS